MSGIITKENREKALHCKSFYSERQYACYPCCKNDCNNKDETNIGKTITDSTYILMMWNLC